MAVPAGPSSRPSLLRNWVTLAGAALAVLSLANIFVLVLLETFATHENPYLGIFIWVLFPLVLILGLGLIPAGMLVERRRQRRRQREAVPLLPRIDLNVARQRRALAVFVGLSFVFLLMSIVGAYQAYEFSSSVTFCGRTCHTVMAPEFVANGTSAHARVGCVECHIGPGATSFVRSKFSGVRQVYAVLTDTYPRPIPSPVAALRPAREICEQCHWPEKFFGDQLRVFTHFRADEANTPLRLRMLMKTGGGSPMRGVAAGIHWHMNIENQVWYVATDHQRQEIPWVRTRNADGRVTEYVVRGATLTAEQIARADKRAMDCVDCHNRPSHVFLPPARAVDDALLAGAIDRTLPAVKERAVEALSQEYATTAAARDGIADALDAFYRTKHPEVYARRRDHVQAAVAEVQRLYETNVFPEMRVDWRTHPDNIGHLYSPGCFRCHDGQHVSSDGRTIGSDCDVCHTLLSQDEDGTPMARGAGAAFEHPIDIGDMGEAACSTCHAGGG